jgi:MFS superfamily sulfate permease-like transporter
VFAATAIPADFELRMKSSWTIAHAVFVSLGPVVFIWAACVWPRALAGLGVSKTAIYACVAAALVMLAAFASNAFLTESPGVGQRFGFAALFLWCGVLSTIAVRVDVADYGR